MQQVVKQPKPRKKVSFLNCISCSNKTLQTEPWKDVFYSATQAKLSKVSPMTKKKKKKATNN